MTGLTAKYHRERVDKLSPCFTIRFAYSPNHKTYKEGILILGWISIIIAVFSLLPSLTSGTISRLDLLASLFALILSISSAKSEKMIYFYINSIVTY